ncbi:hypothetical protein TPCU411_p230 (plasmid) [Cutibacterium acnes]|jgi:hypothetical protein|nr:transcriptional regulator [Cutibacterium acnes]BDE68783.1 hypothetical protein TPCU411_p230 [Cutibacterium acnes]
MRVARTVNLTPDQVRAQLRLFTAIATAQQDGLAVPCTDDPPSWDKESMNPAACDGCPVFELCAVYAATGAVRHGIIAGRHACEMTCHKEAAA